MTATITGPPASLAGYTDQELCAFYGAAHEDAGEWRAALETEMGRRDTAAAKARARQARRDDPVSVDWQSAAYAQYLDAERVCSGSLAVTEAPFTDAFALWSGTHAFAMRWATEELRNYWLDHPRVTVTAYRDQVRTQREAWRSDELDQHEPRRVRRDAGEREEGAGVRADGRGHDVPGPDAGAGARERASAGAAAGAGRTIRGGRVNDTGTEAAARAARRAGMHEQAERIRAQAARSAAAGDGQDTGRVIVPAGLTRPSQAAVALRAGSALVRSGQPAVDGAQTLAYARQFLSHFIVWPSEAALTMATLWAAHCWCRDAGKTLVFASTPRLLFSSLEPGSGKSAAMKLVSRICPEPALFTEPSEPAVAHSIGDHATLFLDEIDVLFGTNGTRKAAIRAVINDGYTPDGYWPRVRNGVTHRMPTFGPLSMAGLDKVESGTSGVMAATLSRCIRIRMRKAPEGFRAPRFDPQARFAAKLIGERLGLWASQNLDALSAHVPELDGIGNREAELFEPPAIVADIAGGIWPELMRDAADELITTGGMPAEDEDHGAQLDEIMAGWAGGEEF